MLPIPSEQIVSAKFAYHCAQLSRGREILASADPKLMARVKSMANRVASESEQKYLVQNSRTVPLESRRRNC